MGESKQVLITGCSSGIGYKAAIDLVDKGYKVIATVRSDDAYRHLTAMGVDAVLMDMNSRESVDQGMKAVEALCGRNLYAVFHNAGYGQAGAIEDVPIDALENQFRVNVFGAHQINRIVIPWMRKQGRGRIVWNSSVLGFVALPYRSVYSSSKYAMEALADGLRLELRGSGICVSILQPGPISTDFRKNSYAAFMKWVDSKESVHQDRYKTLVSRLQKEGDTSSMTLKPEACVECLLDALESKSPKHRYRITRMTKLSLVLKWFLPSVLMDKIAYKSI